MLPDLLVQVLTDNTKTNPVPFPPESFQAPLDADECCDENDHEWMGTARQVRFPRFFCVFTSVFFSTRGYSKHDSPSVFFDFICNRIGTIWIWRCRRC